MCTVSLIPGRESFFLTSNRDEKKIRRQAIPPAIYQYKGARLLYPRDADADGTWIAINQNGNAAVLLNGAFVKHKPRPPYNRSRGLVLLDIIAVLSNKNSTPASGAGGRKSHDECRPAAGRRLGA